MKLKNLFICFFSLFFVFSKIQAQENSTFENSSLSSSTFLTGKNLSDKIFEQTINLGFNPIKMPLCLVQENEFAYNISININSSQFSENRKYNTIIFVFPQDDIINHISFLESFVKWNQAQNLDFNVMIILTACDKSQLAGNDSMTGSEVFANLILGAETYCVIYSNLNAQKITTLTTGSSGKVCPLWLVELVNDSFEKNKINPTISGSFYISLYKENLLRSSRTLSSFLSREIPAVEINVKTNDLSSQNLLGIYQNIVTSFSFRQTFHDDTHYIPIEIGTKHFWITESITIILLLILIAISLVSICDLGFMFRTNHNLKTIATKRALKTLYLVPITILVLTICLEVAQFFALLMYNSFLKNPIAILGIKVMISLILISFAFLLELKFHKHTDSDTYEYLLRFSSLLNVFIFSAIDISLFYLFAIIYIIISISQFFKKTIAIYIFFVLSILPYLQLIFAIATYSTPTQALPLIFATPFYNLLFSCALTPLSIMLLRIYRELRQSKSKEKKRIEENSVKQLQKKLKTKFPKYYVLIQVVTIIIIGTLIVATTFHVQDIFRNKINFETSYARIVDATENNFLVTKYNDSSYYGEKIRQISIDTQMPASRVEVFVSAETENPIYYTTYSTTASENKNQVQFNLPDYPPQTFNIIYTPDNSEISLIEIYAYYDYNYYPKDFINDDSNSRRNLFIKEKASILISPEISQVIKEK